MTNRRLRRKSSNEEIKQPVSREWFAEFPAIAVDECDIRIRVVDILPGLQSEPEQKINWCRDVDAVFGLVNMNVCLCLCVRIEYSNNWFFSDFF